MSTYSEIWMYYVHPQPSSGALRLEVGAQRTVGLIALRRQHLTPYRW